MQVLGGDGFLGRAPMRLIDQIHLRWMKRLLRLNGGNKERAAAALGVSIRTWRNWELNLGIRTVKKVRAHAR